MDKLVVNYWVVEGDQVVRGQGSGVTGLIPFWAGRCPMSMSNEETPFMIVAW